MNTRKIQPIDFWINGITQSADIILLHNFHGYNFDGTDSMVSYKLGFEKATEGSDENPLSVTFVSLSENSVCVPNDVVQTWGEDDEPIFDFVIDKLGLKRA
ncbi:MAG: hypothetical protein ACO24B_01605 [Ilumatobacteraceae bacterium]